MTLKNVKVTEDVKKQLDDISIEKETYNVTIQRLLNENKLLKARCDELKQDKELFIELTQMSKARRVKHNAILEPEDIEILLKEGVNDFYRQEYKVNVPLANYSVSPLELVGLASIINALYEIDIEYDENYDFDKNKLFKLSDRLQAIAYNTIEYKRKDYDELELDDFFYQILKCNVRDYNVKDDLLEYFKE